jgi:hypothetical protein
MNRPLLVNTFGAAAVMTADVMAAPVPAAHADSMTPGWDDTFVIDSCALPIQVLDTVKWFKEINRPHDVKDIRAGRTLDCTNLDTGKTWHVTGDVTSSWVDHPDGSVTRPSTECGRRPVHCTPSTTATGPGCTAMASRPRSPSKATGRPLTSASSSADAHHLIAKGEMSR